MSEDKKNKALEAAVASIEKDFGKGSIMRLGGTDRMIIDFWPTGILNLDFALGIGGLPKGRIVECYGPESSGKSTLAFSIMGNIQRLGGIAALVDAEHAFDPNYAKSIGVDVDALLVSQPDTGEQGLSIVETLVRSGAVDIIVVDSVAALVPAAEIEGDMGDSHMGLQARLMGQALRKLTGIISKTGTVVIFINQLRMKLNVMFGSPETTTGGNALKFYCSVRIDIRAIGKITEGTKEDKSVLGNHVRAKVVKNKVAPPFREAEFDIIFGKGVSKEGIILDMAVERNIVEKSGTWFSYKQERLGQGRDSVIGVLACNTKLLEEIEKAVRATFLKKSTTVEEPPEAKDEPFIGVDMAIGTPTVTRTPMTEEDLNE